MQNLESLLIEPDADDLLVRRPGAMPTLTGYAAVYYDPADPATVGRADDGAELRIMPGAHQPSLGQDRVIAEIDHEAALRVGCELDKSMRLAADARGLRFWLDPPDTWKGRQLVAAVRSGQIGGASCRYVVRRKTEARGDNGRLVRSIWAISLIEAGPVASPRFPGACVWIEQPTPELDELERFLAVMRNLERAEAQ